MSQRSEVRTSIKKVLAAVAEGDRETAEARYKEAVPLIDSMVNKGILHANKAARHKSRLNAKVRGIQA
jgi:small subunit ribosomal protein S20